MSKNVHVTQRADDMWQAKVEGASRASKVCKTQAEAIQFGRASAIYQGGELLIHGVDGKIREKRSYGNDPYPPRG
jgi:hypothetical protein